MKKRDRIRKVITSSGLAIFRAVQMKIPFEILDEIYTDLSPPLREATLRYMGNAPCEIGEVVGENAVLRLLAVCGEHTDPNECSHPTIRNRFGVKEAEKIIGGKYFKNAIHRPKNESEARRDLNVFRPFLEPRIQM